jgi:hypothetical protein
VIFGASSPAVFEGKTAALNARCILLHFRKCIQTLEGDLLAVPAHRYIARLNLRGDFGGVRGRVHKVDILARGVENHDPVGRHELTRARTRILRQLTLCKL